MNKFKSQSGNIFTMLFAAVAMTGVLGVVGMQTVSGPITTITKVTQKNITDTDLLTNARILILNAGIQAAGGDSDGDNYVEPIEYITNGAPGCTNTPSGGGCIPATIGAILTDPFGTDYGYCVWDHGLTDTGKNDAGVGANNRLQGEVSTSQPVIAVIAAGRDKTFQTSCDAFDGAGDEGIVEVVGSDDTVRFYSYDAAVAGANGLWQLKSGDPTTAEIVKDLEIGDFGAGTGFSFDISTGEGEFPSVKTDVLAPKTGNNVDMAGGLKLDDQVGVTSCGAGDAGVIRYNSATKIIEVCDGAGDWDGADETLLSDEDGDTLVQVEESADDDTIRFDTAGVERMIVLPNGNVGIGVSVPSVPLSIDGGTPMGGFGSINMANATMIITDSGGKTLAFDGDSIFTDNSLLLGTIGGNSLVFGTNNTERMVLESDGDLIVDTDTLFVDATNNRVGINESSPAYTLHVNSTQDQTALFRSTASSWIIAETLNDTSEGSILVLKNPSQQWNIGMTSVDGSTLEDNFYIQDLTDSSIPFLIEHGTGNVGIGTHLPDATLHIVDQGTTKPALLLSGATNTEGDIAWVEGEHLNIGEWNTTTDTFQERMTIIDGGNVGIGEASPDTLLDIDGAIEIGAGTCGAGGDGRLQYTAGNDIQYCNGTSWQTITGYVAELDDIGDVNVTGVISGQTIMWNGSEWIATNTLGNVSTGDSDVLIDDDGDTQIQVEEGPDDDTIRFDTAGTERMTIDSAGVINVDNHLFFNRGDGAMATASDILFSSSGLIAAENTISLNIDATNDGGGNFHIRKGAETDAGTSLLSVQNDGDLVVDTNTLFVDATNNRVGVGKIPDVQLHVYKDGQGLIRVEGGAVGSPARRAIFEAKSDVLGRAHGMLMSSNQSPWFAGIGYQSTGGFMIGQHATQPEYKANAKFIIQTDGNVGIAKINPTSKLHVDGDLLLTNSATTCGATQKGAIRLNATADGLEMCDGAGTWDAYSGGGGGGGDALADADGDTQIQVEEGPDDDTIRFDTAGTERMYIDSNGVVAILPGGTSASATYFNSWDAATHTDIDGLLPGSTFGSLIQGPTNAHLTVGLKDNDVNDSFSVISGGGNYSVDSIYDTVILNAKASGHVGIGSSDTDATLTITGAPDISAVNTAGQGGLIIQGNAGNTTGRKMRFDANEIQITNNGVGATLFLNPFGGNVSLASSNHGSSNLDMNTGKIVDLLDPTANQDAATKKYVDDQITAGGADNLGAGGTTAGTLYTSGGHIGRDSTDHIRFDNNAQAFWKINGVWEYQFYPTNLSPYANNTNDLGTSAKKWQDIWTDDIMTNRVCNNTGANCINQADLLSSAGTVDADTLDGLDSLQFIRSDADDNVTAHTEWQDSKQVRLGNSADFRMWFNATDTYMRSYNHGARWILQGEDAGGTNKNMIVADPDNSVYLYYQGLNKLRTSIDGIVIPGGTTGNEGGEVRLNTSDPYDTTYDYYYMDTYQDDFRIGRAGVGTDFKLKNTGEIQISNATLRLNAGGSNGNVGTGADIRMTNAGLIAADDDLYINIDANNSSTSESVVFGKNTLTSSATEIFRIRETGIVRFKSIAGASAPTK